MIHRRKPLLNNFESLKSLGAFLKGSDGSQNYLKNVKFTHNSAKIYEIEIQYKIKALFTLNRFWDKRGHLLNALSHKAPPESVYGRQKTLKERRAPLAAWGRFEKKMGKSS